MSIMGIFVTTSYDISLACKEGMGGGGGGGWLLYFIHCHRRVLRGERTSKDSMNKTLL